MISKEQFIKALTAEFAIIQHLAKKVTPEMSEYRPTPGQRSMLELLNYLGHIFELGTTLNVQGHSKNYQELAAGAPVVTLENFNQVMDGQLEKVVAMLNALSDAQMQEDIEVWGMTAPRALHMLSVMKWAVAYKMQLFLYLKSCGLAHISTMNLWRGTDPAPKE